MLSVQDNGNDENRVAGYIILLLLVKDKKA